MTFFVFSVLPAPDSPLFAGLLRARMFSGVYLRNQDGLIGSISEHVSVCGICNGIYMWRCFIALLVFVRCHELISVDLKLVIWIHCDQKKS